MTPVRLELILALGACTAPPSPFSRIWTCGAPTATMADRTSRSWLAPRRPGASSRCAPR